MQLPNVTRDDGRGESQEDTNNKAAADDSKAKKMGIEGIGASISLKTFVDYTASLADKWRDVNLRLI